MNLVRKTRIEILSSLGFFILYIGYAFFAFHASPADEKWIFDTIEGLNQLAIDDAYRFFETRSAWQNSGIWSWAYLLPVDVAFKGVLHVLTGSDLFWMRMGQVTVNLLGVYALYCSCLLLGVRKILALLVCVSLMLMPLFMVVSMSFYGESLLGAMLSWAMYFKLSGRKNLLIATAGLMPLVQLQGLFLISGYFLYFLLRKHWHLFFLLAVPGFVYFINVMVVHHGVFEFLSFTQLHKLYPALPVPIQERGWLGGFETFNPFLVVFSVFGAVVLWKRVWPIYAGVMLWFIMVSTAMTYTNGYEPRYLFPCLPAIFLTFAVFLNSLWSWIEQHTSKFVAFAASLVILLILTLENLGQSDPIRANYLKGVRWPIGEPHIGSRYFVTVKSNSERYGKDLARRVESFLTENKEYKLLAVNQHEIFYYLDRGNMPRDVRVVYTPFPPLLAYPAFDGRFHALSPDHPQAGFYRFFHSGGAGKGKALVIADFSPLGWKPSYKNQQYSVYELNYEMPPAPERIYIINRMKGVESDSSHYKGKNLCPGEEGVFCPDWREGSFFDFE